jgi:hypothetical protein
MNCAVLEGAVATIVSVLRLTRLGSEVNAGSEYEPWLLHALAPATTLESGMALWPCGSGNRAGCKRFKRADCRSLAQSAEPREMVAPASEVDVP